MRTTNNTVLITGGSAGIGFEIARQFASAGNRVIITGRDEIRLQKAVSELPGVTAIVCDVTKADDVDRLISQVITNFPELNILVNNAGQAFLHHLADFGTYEKASGEILTNYLSIIRLNEKLLPLLTKKNEAAIVHVSSIVAFTPNHMIATYSASKAALHSYSLSLRLSLEKNTSVKVFELMPPLVNTDFSQDIGGANGIHPSIVAEELMHAMDNNEYEIHVEKTAYIYDLSRSSPADALAAMNQ
ncbi:MAG: short-chain dehydrogenase [Marivirga sp.]|nr:short-chain dehydrogenase [Marivirga sp.]